MKTDEQVLKEWALDRIEFRFDRRRYYTKAEFVVLSRALFMAPRRTTVNLLKNQAHFFNPAGRKIYKVLVSALHNEDDEVLVTVRKKLKNLKFKHLRQMEHLVRFESIDALYDHVTGRDQQYEEC